MREGLQFLKLSSICCQSNTHLFYFLAIRLCEDSVGDATLAVCLKNRAAVYLKEEDYELVIADCTRYDILINRKLKVG